MPSQTVRQHYSAHFPVFYPSAFDRSLVKRQQKGAVMAIFVLSDPHLAIHNREKSMEAFGSRWQNYVHRIEKNWRAVVGEHDTVVLPGDISWAMTLEQAADDFAFLDALPGQKLLGKGNHDFFWTTATKMNTFFKRHGFHSLRLLYNNAYLIDELIVCGTRGWFIDEKQQRTVGEVDYAKIVNRETLRLRMSLDVARALQAKHGKEYEIVPFLHFPPVFGEFRCQEILNTLSEYRIRRCYYGHIHTPVTESSSTEIEGIRYILCAADHLRFTPLPVFSTEIFYSP